MVSGIQRGELQHHGVWLISEVMIPTLSRRWILWGSFPLPKFFMSRNEGMNGAGRYGSVPSSDAGAALQYSDDDDVRDGSTGVGKANSHHHPQHHGYELNRHMSLFDLVSVGVGATVGSGVFVLTGTCVYIFFRQLTVFLF